MRVRLASTENVVHTVHANGMTECGVMYATLEDLDVRMTLLAIGTSVDDPVDCMTCLVRECDGDGDGRFIAHLTLSEPMPYVAMTFVINPEPDK